jgi:hypothetical protein
MELDFYYMLCHFLAFQNHTVIVSPVIDIIDKENMVYSIASPSVRGGFDAGLHFKWDTIPSKELRARKSPIDPIATPSIAGGLFAVDKEWFHHIGEYDSQMDIWGAENVGKWGGGEDGVVVENIVREDALDVDKRMRGAEISEHSQVIWCFLSHLAIRCPPD